MKCFNNSAMIWFPTIHLTPTFIAELRVESSTLNPTNVYIYMVFPLDCLK